jgi:thiol-disulfide isomerase/thioredoxin
MTRRPLLLGAGVAAVAALAGAGVGLWRHRLADTSDDASAVFNLVLERPEGGTLALASLRSKPLLLNFWATWCPPCIRELPELNRFQRDHRAAGWTVLALAVDSPAPVREFLGKLPLDMPVVLAGLPGTELARTLGNAQGGLPFSVMLDASGRVRHRKLGQTHYAELASWARQVHSAP